MRTLASIQTILALNLIPNADAIEVASVLGWKVVVKKGDFKVGDLCVYFEIDSFLPVRDEFEFLRNSCYRKMADGSEGFRIRTIKLRGQVSQGICMPLSILETAPPAGYKFDYMPNDMPVTEILGVKKWEPPVPAELQGLVKGTFPSFLQKSDETRVQVLQDVLDRYRGVKFYTTEKLDGSSATFYHRNGEFGVCSRNIELKETPENTFWRVARQIGLEENMRTMGDFALQGELFGEGIQKNRLGMIGQHLRFFNLFNINTFVYEDFHILKAYCAECDYLNMVPVIDDEFIMGNDITALVEYATRKSCLNPNAWMEGVVFRPLHEIVDMEFSTKLPGGRISFKVINPEYLLKHGE